jgi:hypothetical protein
MLVVSAPNRRAAARRMRAIYGLGDDSSLLNNPSAILNLSTPAPPVAASAPAFDSTGLLQNAPTGMVAIDPATGLPFTVNNPAAQAYVQSQANMPAVYGGSTPPLVGSSSLSLTSILPYLLIAGGVIILVVVLKR